MIESVVQRLAGKYDQFRFVYLPKYEEIMVKGQLFIMKKHLIIKYNHTIKLL